MKQTPAAILILTSSVLAYAATAGGTTTIATNGGGLTTQTSAIGVILALGSFVLGVWGVVSLIAASYGDQEMSLEGTTRSDLFSMLDPRRAARPYAVGNPVGNPVAARPTPVADTSAVQLSPELKAQLSMASHLEGRDRNEIIEEALRRYLPNFENPKAA